MGELGDLLGLGVALWLLWHLVRLPGRSSRGLRITVRVPWRSRFPRAWRALVVFVLLVVVPVLWLASSCGWWGL
ncbi:hypothetical protein ACQP1W_38795 [Spirillospora sp. CA-255316]